MIWQPSAPRRCGSSNGWSGYWQRILGGAIAALALTACTHGTRPPPAPTLPPMPPPAMPEQLREPCPARLPVLADDSLPALLSNYLAAAQEYHRCRCKMARLIQAQVIHERAAWKAWCDALAAEGLRDAGCTLPAPPVNEGCMNGVD